MVKMRRLNVYAAGVLTVLAAACAAVSLAALGGAFCTRLDVLTHVAPLTLSACLAVLALGLSLQRGRMRAVTACLCALAASASAALIVPELVDARTQAAAPAPAARETLRIIQFNAWGGNATPGAALAWILAQHPDIVVLEEGGKIAKPLVATGRFAATCRTCRTTILARRPVFSVADPAPMPPGTRPLIVAATFQDSRGDFTVIGVHRHWPTRLTENRDEDRALRAAVAGRPRGRLIVAGDFNSTPWSFARRRDDRDLGLIRRTRALFTWPAARVSHNHLPALIPVFPIDHVYAGPDWTTVSVSRGPRLGSDHYPVVVVLAPR